MKPLIFFLLLLTNYSYAQTFRGNVLTKDTNQPIGYVNIGIAGKGVGTVSDATGKYSLQIERQYDEDTLLVSMIGYDAFKMKVADFRKRKDHTIYLKEKATAIREIVVKPRKFKNKTMGVKTTSKLAQAGFKDKQLGYECGILMKVKKSAFLERVNINFAGCTYDTIFYRLNIYRAKDERTFDNILTTPIYLELPKSKTLNTVTVDLTPYNLTVDGDVLVTLEHVKDLGPGSLLFCAGLGDKTYYRKTSQGNWETAPIGVSISVDADVEI